MSSFSLQNFREYIENSTSTLLNTLDQVLEQESFQYDVIYETFLKIIENYKINILSELKFQLFPGSHANDQQQRDRLLLQQMKNLMSTKIKK